MAPMVCRQSEVFGTIDPSDERTLSLRGWSFSHIRNNYASGGNGDALTGG